MMESKLSRMIFVGLAVAGAATIGIALYLIFAVAPIEAKMGIVQKIFYFHVPAGMAMVLLAGAVAACSLGYLLTRKEILDEISVAAAEITMIFATISLITGPLWARKAWSGVWWTWDARLTSTLLLWIVLAGYMMLRSLGGAGARRFAAGLAVFAGLDAAIIYLSVKLWGGQHPSVMDEGLGSNIHPGMRPPLYVSMLGYFFIAAMLFWLRMALERARNRLRELKLRLSERGVEVP